MGTPSSIGTFTEGMVLTALLKLNKRVLIPFGDGTRYDLAYDDEGKLIRVQCKTAWIEKGCLVFHSCSQGRKHETYDYHEDADLFGVYSPDTKCVYIVPVEDVGKSKGHLRLEQPKGTWAKSSSRYLRWADTYKVA